MSLDDYYQKRDFEKTPEPRGDAALGTSGKSRFVIQKHDARSLHYDLRLESDGVLKSWAIPKGPSQIAEHKRLAIETEDHPMDYLLFEGVIPEGEYGGGTVMVWDTGTWELVKGSLKSGRLTFQLHGKKLSGAWRIFKTNRQSGKKRQWLLNKVDDAQAKPATTEIITATQPLSVLSNRSLQEIANDRDRIWTADCGMDESVGSGEIESGQPDGGLQCLSSGSTAEMQQRIRTFLSSLAEGHSDGSPELDDAIKATDGVRPAPFPLEVIEPAKPVSERNPPLGDDWIHEIKYDGYRMVCWIQDGKARFLSRNGKDWTDKLQRLASHAARLPIRNAIIDGEVAIVGDDGRTDFQELQTLIGSGDDRSLTYFVFDAIHLNGHDLRSATLLDRKKILRLLLPSEHPVFQFCDFITGQGDIVFAQASKLGTEGIVSKRASSRYVSGRTEEWVKIKCLSSAEFVVGGYTVSDTASRKIASLVLGRHEDGELIYEGRVGTGFTAATLSELEESLTSKEIDDSPFANLDRSAGREYRWVQPEMVVEVEYGGWTRERILRFPSYRGRRDEFAPKDIVRVPDAKTKRSASASVDNTATSTVVAPPMTVDFDSLSDFRLTHPERIVYPQDGVTKLGLATYYGRIAGWMLPHVIDRPLALVRCPKGMSGRCFFQKKPMKGMPSAIECPEIAAEGRTTQNPPLIRDLEGLLALIQFGTLEIHTWGCGVDRPDRPDMITFDLDPDESISFHLVIEAAVMLRELLEDLDLKGYLKTTGGKGLHVVVPIRRRSGWEDVTTFCDAVSRRMVGQSPSRFTTSPSKSARKGKIYLDTLRNRFGATSIAPFSTRAKDHATISMPIAWEELVGLTAGNVYSISNAFHRMEHLTMDPWVDFYETNQGLSQSLLKKLPAWAKREK